MQSQPIEKMPTPAAACETQVEGSVATEQIGENADTSMESANTSGESTSTEGEVIQSSVEEIDQLADDVVEETIVYEPPTRPKTPALTSVRPLLDTLSQPDSVPQTRTESVCESPRKRKYEDG